MSQSWLLFALSGPILWAASTHLDKYLIERYFRNVEPAVLPIFTGLANVVALPFIVALNPGVLDIGWRAIGLMTFSGVLLLGAMLLYLQALQSEEASVVAPFFQAAPLFAIALGYGLLGERLSGRQLIGAVLIIAGTLAAAVRIEGGAGKVKGRLVVLMLGCALGIAVSSLIFKIFALKDEFWTTTVWLFVGESLFAAAILARTSYRRQFFSVLAANTSALLVLNAGNEAINLAAGLGTRYALTLAPLGVVQAVSSTTTIFVFLFGLGLSLAFPSIAREDLSHGELLRKGAAAVLVALGVALVGA